MYMNRAINQAGSEVGHKRTGTIVYVLGRVVVWPRGQWWHPDWRIGSWGGGGRTFCGRRTFLGGRRACAPGVQKQVLSDVSLC